jgi:hypothetical protein
MELGSSSYQLRQILAKDRIMNLPINGFCKHPQ